MLMLLCICVVCLYCGNKWFNLESWTSEVSVALALRPDPREEGEEEEEEKMMNKQKVWDQQAHMNLTG